CHQRKKAVHSQLPIQFCKRQFKITTQSQEPISLDPIKSYKLHSMGLIDYLNNRVAISCNLYQRYFELAFTELDR
ncbi:MAG: AAA-like domain-containing protein, partial [Cyanobacteria bacterium J06555_12]